MVPLLIFAQLLRGPSPADWNALSRFDGTLTERTFESRLDRVFDPAHGLAPYLRLEPGQVAIYGDTLRRGAPWAVVRFARREESLRPAPDSFGPPAEFRGERPHSAAEAPLAGLRVVIEPADIGGSWAKLEDRSVEFPGYGLIREGDLNLRVARRLQERLTALGASVFMVRKAARPVLPIDAAHLPEAIDAATKLLTRNPDLQGDLVQNRELLPAPRSPGETRFAAGLLLTKTLETRARAALVRRSFTPDLTIVLQHNATPESGEGKLTRSNRNIFFVHGAYRPGELGSAEQRYCLLTKLLEDTPDVEIPVANAIAERFRRATGYPPVLYGNSANTVLVAGAGPYVVARNLAFNREHDGPVVVTEPYFMNQPDTLARLMAGDYPGQRRIAGKLRPSIVREYADCVAEGVRDAYGR